MIRGDPERKLTLGAKHREGASNHCHDPLGIGKICHQSAHGVHDQAHHALLD